MTISAETSAAREMRTDDPPTFLQTPLLILLTPGEVLNSNLCLHRPEEK